LFDTKRGNSVAHSAASDPTVFLEAIAPLVRTGLEVDIVGDDLLILDIDGKRVIRVPAANFDEVVNTLDAHGLLADSQGITRRNMLVGAAVVGLAGATVLALPAAAAAASGLAAPTGVTATPGNTQVVVDWTNLASPATGVTYQVYYKLSTADPTNYVTFGGPVAAGPVTVTSLTNGSGYDFYVVAIVNSTPSTPSEVKTATPTIANLGVTWVGQNVTTYSVWSGVTYGNGLFVAVGSFGSPNQVMTSPDGVTWTDRTAPVNRWWRAVAYGEPGGNPLFVAVAYNSSAGGGNRVMTSPDGITWTARTSAADNGWFDIAYGNGLFVAVSSDGTNRVMTSPDGTTWTGRSAAAANQWKGVTYAAGKFVAVARDGTGNRVMTSTDGITWTSQVSPDSEWLSVTYGNGLFVAVAGAGTNRVMTSPDGETWTTRTAASNIAWQSVSYGGGKFVAVANNGFPNQIMTSTDGITWTSQTSPSGQEWQDVTFGDDKFVAVNAAGNVPGVMLSPAPA
jgi:hypothetical protein